MSNKTKQLLNIISWIGIIPPLFLALLLPQPYTNGVTSDIFGDNITALILFVFLCISISLGSFILNYFTRIITYEKVRNQINEWKSEMEIQNLHSMIPTILNVVNEMEALDNKTARERQREYIKSLNDAWEVEKNLNFESEMKLKEAMDKIKIMEEEKAQQDLLIKQHENEINKFIKEQTKGEF